MNHTQAPSVSVVLVDACAIAAGTLVTLNPNQSILLAGVAPNTLHPNNFQVV